MALLGYISSVHDGGGNISRFGKADLPFVASELKNCTTADLMEQPIRNEQGGRTGTTPPRLGKCSYSEWTKPDGLKVAVNVSLLDDQTVDVMAS